MRAAGWQAEAVADGAEALAVVHAFEPDVIVMDLALPIIDGISATKRLKADPATAHIPVVACTAYFHARISDIYGVEFDAIVEKPCPPESLLARLEKLVKLVRGD